MYEQLRDMGGEPESRTKTSDAHLPLVAKVSEVAIYLRSSEPTVRELIRTNRLRAIRCGRSIRVPRSAVDAFIRGEASEGSAK